MKLLMRAAPAKIGITLKLKVVACSVWSAELYGPKTFGASFGSYHSSIVDPSGLAAYLLGSQAIPAGGLNAANYGPAPVDSLLQAGVTTSSTSRRPGERELAREMNPTQADYSGRYK